MAGASAGEVGPQALDRATGAAYAELSARFPNQDSLLLRQAARAAVLAAFVAAGITVGETELDRLQMVFGEALDKFASGDREGGGGD